MFYNDRQRLREDRSSCASAPQLEEGKPGLSRTTMVIGFGGIDNKGVGDIICNVIGELEKKGRCRRSREVISWKAVARGSAGYCLILQMRFRYKEPTNPWVPSQFKPPSMEEINKREHPEIVIDKMIVHGLLQSPLNSCFLGLPL